MPSHSATALSLVVALVACSHSHSFAQTQPSGGWHLVEIPDAWRNVPGGELKPIDGNSWYRALVKVPADWAGSKTILFVEALDDARAAYINGTKVGATGTFPPRFRSGLGETGRYAVDARLLKPGELNVVAIRVHQYDPRPNFSVAPPVLLNESSMQAIRLDGAWQYHPGDDEAYATATVAEILPTELNNADAAMLRTRAVYSTVDNVDDVERYVTARKGDHDPLTPREAELQFEVPDDLQIQLVLSEPDIAQPLFMTWDARGRLWVVEYRQYPEVAGVQMLSRDVFLRSVYDKIPEPPPHGARGRDRITIHEDVDGDGVYDQHKTFVDGLNIASSVAIGRGGAFVTNPPYLLFYPDSDGDDIPDGDPEVLLEGFGLEDSHSVINSLRFGPDGWLYGAQGSTVSAKVKVPGSMDPPIQTMGQQIWRYHPEQKRFEVFAEGGGNTFGCEFDNKGNVYSGHNGGDTRGFHYVQGGYYRKGFGKHGPLSNPFAFGYFENIKHAQVARFTHNFIIYEERRLPNEYHGRLFGIEPLQGQVVMSDIRSYQSSFETEDISRVVKTEDQWFRPVDIKAGPDGSIFIADMYEQRIDHSSHYAGRIDRSSGRVYRLHSKLPSPGTKQDKKKEDLEQLSSQKLVDLLQSPAKWTRQTALRILGDRADSGLVPTLQERLAGSNGQDALEYLWALNLCGGLKGGVAMQCLNHEDQYVRAWTVRLICDANAVVPEIAKALASLAANEPYIQVRKQLASSARRLPAADALPIIRSLLNYDEDSADIHQPLLLWWAIESKASADREAILEILLADRLIWQRPIMREHISERLMKRFALEGTRDSLVFAANLLNLATEKTDTDLLLKGFEEAYKGRSLAGLPDELAEAIAATGGGSTALRLRQGDKRATQLAIAAIADSKTKIEEKRQFIEILGELKQQEFIPVLLSTVTASDESAVVSAALSALQSFDDVGIAKTVVEHFRRLPVESRDAAETMLASRLAWATVLVTAVDKKILQTDEVSNTALKKIQLHGNAAINDLIAKNWGPVSGATTAQMQSEMDRLAQVLGSGSGNPKKGKSLYMQNCGRCHLLFEEGGRIGPDLTPFKRDNQERILTNIVNPGLEIREGFENHVVVTIDGRVLNGFLADKDNQVLVLRGVDGQNVVLRHDEIEEMQVSKVSIMPEGTMKGLSDQQVRDLFAYLRSSQPVNY
ncbi:MAG: PVC-type heme-binding CxxCH protein [Fuerstiella sp.]